MTVSGETMQKFQVDLVGKVECMKKCRIKALERFLYGDMREIVLARVSEGLNWFKT